MKNKLLYIFLLLILLSCGGNIANKLDSSIMATSMIANQLDNSNESVFYDAENFYSYLKIDLKMAENNKQEQLRTIRLTELLTRVDSIENSCAKLITLIEGLKINLLKQEGENISAIIGTDTKNLKWGKDNTDLRCLPTKLNLSLIQNPRSTKYVNRILVGNNSTTISTKGNELWEAIDAYRRTIVKYYGTYRSRDEFYSIDVKSINNFQSQSDLKLMVEKMINDSKVNLREDSGFMTELYMSLTKPKFITKNGVEMHWVNATFADVPLISAITLLSSLENEILQARKLVYFHFEIASGGYGNSFNQIIPFATGKSIIVLGDSLQLKVSMVAFDSDRNPNVTIDGYDAKIEYQEGLGLVNIKPRKGLQIIRGEVTMITKSGQPRTKPWEWTVNVIAR